MDAETPSPRFHESLNPLARTVPLNPSCTLLLWSDSASVSLHCLHLASVDFWSCFLFCSRYSLAACLIFAISISPQNPALQNERKEILSSLIPSSTRHSSLLDTRAGLTPVSFIFFLYLPFLR